MKHETTRSAEVVQVVRTVSLRGEGVEGDPVRQVTQYWSLCGEPLAEHDPQTSVIATTIEVKMDKSFMGAPSVWTVAPPHAPQGPGYTAPEMS